EGDGLLRPRDGVQLGGIAPAVSVDAPGLAIRLTLRIDREHDALRAETIRSGADEFGTFDRGSVERNLVGSALKHGFDVADGAQAAAHRERHETLLGRRRYDVVHDRATVAGGGDIEKDEFVRAL